MTSTSDGRRASPRAGDGTPRSRALHAAIAFSTAVTITGVSLVVLLQPIYLHAALDVAGSSRWLGLPAEVVHRTSDRTVAELVSGPGTFAFPAPGGSGPFYDPSEAAHLADARVVLLAFLALVVGSALLLSVALLRAGRHPAVWRAVSRGGGALAAGTVVVGVVGFVAFDAIFELFHRLAFPGGNYLFDPTRQRLVQLYPIPFWQLTSAALGALCLAGGLTVWVAARRRAMRLAARDRAPVPASETRDVDTAGARSEPVSP